MDEFNPEDRRHILSLSGGKDSTALALYMKDKVDDMEYVFCDTGREPPSLYGFTDELEVKDKKWLKWGHGGTWGDKSGPLCSGCGNREKSSVKMV